MSGYSDGRHPDKVVYAKSPEEDVRRRDFTINALLLDPETGQVLDFVGGRKDIEAGIIRAIGPPEERFRRRQTTDDARGAVRVALSLCD